MAAPAAAAAAATAPSFGLRDFQYHEQVGTGSYAKVLRATRTGPGEPAEVAIKIVDKAHVIKHSKVKYVKQERDILTLLVADPAGRQHVISLLATFQTQAELFYVTEVTAHPPARPCLRDAEDGCRRPCSSVLVASSWRSCSGVCGAVTAAC